LSLITNPRDLTIEKKRKEIYLGVLRATGGAISAM